MTLLSAFEANKQAATGLFAMLGHKGDLMVVHFRKTLDDLNDAELAIANSELNEYLEPTTSYLSVVELGLYEGSVKLYSELTAKGLKPGTADWNREVEAELSKQREASAPRLWPEIPARRYLCFYPMNKYRGEAKNWYSEPIGSRQRMMRDHGMIGRHYAGRVTQIISGSIGFDDWEWGVDLFADDPLVFKKLVYEMRFDEASAVYGLTASGIALFNESILAERGFDASTYHRSLVIGALTGFEPPKMPSSRLKVSRFRETSPPCWST